jgi:hypothetical protein
MIRGIERRTLVDDEKDREDCVFRAIPATDSGRSRPPIPGEAGHPFRGNPATPLFRI